MIAVRYYILDENRNVIPVDGTEWSVWFEKTDRVVMRTALPSKTISTVFVGIGPNELFETMVFPFSAMNEEWMERTSTWNEALDAHMRGFLYANGISLPE